VTEASGVDPTAEIELDPVALIAGMAVYFRDRAALARQSIDGRPSIPAEYTQGRATAFEECAAYAAQLASDLAPPART